MYIKLLGKTRFPLVFPQEEKQHHDKREAHNTNKLQIGKTITIS